jgi:hypothetical protein
VPLYGSYAEHQVGSNVLIAVPGENQTQDVALATRQSQRQAFNRFGRCSPPPAGTAPRDRFLAGSARSGGTTGTPSPKATASGIVIASPFCQARS